MALRVYKGIAMRILRFIILIMGVSACGGHKEKARNTPAKQSPQAQFLEYYYDQQIGGTPEAGINEIYYFRLTDESAIIKQLKVGGETIDLSSPDGVLFTGSTSLQSADQLPETKYRKVELFGEPREGEGEMYWQIDSVPLRQKIFMPSPLSD